MPLGIEGSRRRLILKGRRRHTLVRVIVVIRTVNRDVLLGFQACGLLREFLLIGLFGHCTTSMHLSSFAGRSGLPAPMKQKHAVGCEYPYEVLLRLTENGLFGFLQQTKP